MIFLNNFKRLCRIAGGPASTPIHSPDFGHLAFRRRPHPGRSRGNNVQSMCHAKGGERLQRRHGRRPIDRFGARHGVQHGSGRRNGPVNLGFHLMARDPHAADDHDDHEAGRKTIGHDAQRGQLALRFLCEGHRRGLSVGRFRHKGAPLLPDMAFMRTETPRFPTTIGSLYQTGSESQSAIAINPVFGR